MRIIHNIPALQSYNALAKTNDNLAKSINRLSTGLRINSAADDAAGLAISEKMRSQIRGLDQANRNAQDAISMIQTAEGALGEVHSMLQRMRELAVQAANDTLTQEDRSYIQIEIDQLKGEISRIASTTQFNRKQLLDGSAGAIWSTDNLETKVIVNGGLRTIDRFGQKGALEGNFRITIDSIPGQSQAQKSDLFKIKHPNVIMDVTMNTGAGIQAVRVDSLPAGDYAVQMTVGKYDADTPADPADPSANYKATKTTGQVHGAFLQKRADIAGGDSAEKVAQLLDITWDGLGIQENQSILMEVASVDEAIGNVSFRVQIKGMTIDGIATSHSESNFLVSETGISGAFTSLGWNVQTNPGPFKLKAGAASNFTVGDKIVFNVTPVESVNADAPGKPAEVTKPADWDTMIAGYTGAPGDKGAIDIYIDTKGPTPGDDTYDAGQVADLKSYNKYINEDLPNWRAANVIEADMSVKVSGTLNSAWNEMWNETPGDETSGPASFESNYNIRSTDAANNEIHFQQYYINEGNGTTYEGSTVITFAQTFVLTNVGDDPGDSVTAATFEAAYIGQVAKGDVQLRDLDKFWDANGKFLLENAQSLTMLQGDGTKATFTIYSTDTLAEVRRKMNDTIANGLGQGKYCPENINNFVTFVDPGNAIPNSPVSVEGTFVIRSVIPGSDGRLSFSGDENVIRAFSLNTIQESTESQFRVGVYDAHTGATVASSVKISGNKLYGIVAPNIDVRFDPMADIEAKWNPNTQKFDLISQSGVYSTIVHLMDNSTIFQIGANESEDMSIDIGDMGAFALGIANINVSDRENAAKALGKVDMAIGLVSKQRAKLGAYQNRLEYTVSNLTMASSNTSSAESRIRDADMAMEMMEFTKLNILSQAGNSMLAQANQLPQNVMALLRG